MKLLLLFEILSARSFKLCHGPIDHAASDLFILDNFEILDVSPGDLGDVEQSIVKGTKKSIRFPGQALLFVHGYNVTHARAVKRAAQIAYDLEFDGALILFSWNSHGLHSPRPQLPTAPRLAPPLVFLLFCKRLLKMGRNIHGLALPMAT